VNVQRREQYRAHQHQVKVDELNIDVDLPPAAYLYLYRAKRADSPVHAVAASVWQGDQQLLSVRPIHCAGLTGRRLKQYLVQMLDEIHQQFITVVKEGRGERLKNDPDIFSGRVWNGEQAVQLGLVDGYGTVDSVARDILKTPDVVEYTLKENFAERVAKRFGAETGAAISKALTRSAEMR